MERLWGAAENLQTPKSAPLLPPCSSGHRAGPSAIRAGDPWGVQGMCEPSGLRRGQRVKRQGRFLKTRVAYSLATGRWRSPQGPRPSLSTEGLGTAWSANACKAGFLGTCKWGPWLSALRAGLSLQMY